MRIGQDRSSLTGRAAGTAGSATVTNAPRGESASDVPANGAPAVRYGELVIPSPHPLPYGAREREAVPNPNRARARAARRHPGSSPGRRRADRVGCEPPSHPEYLAVAGLDL